MYVLVEESSFVIYIVKSDFKIFFKVFNAIHLWNRFIKHKNTTRVSFWDVNKDRCQLESKG